MTTPTTPLEQRAREISARACPMGGREHDTTFFPCTCRRNGDLILAALQQTATEARKEAMETACKAAASQFRWPLSALAKAVDEAIRLVLLGKGE